MAEEASKSEEARPTVVDRQNDMRWQERLAEARERRAQALKEMGRDGDESRQPRKPWEEEAPVSQPTADRPKPKPEKVFDFLDRVNTLKRVTGRENKEDLDPTGREPPPDQNWYPGADDEWDAAAPINGPPLTAPEQSPTEGNKTDRPKKRRQKSVDEIFNGPTFGQDVFAAPVSVHLQPTELAPPSRNSRPWLQHQDDIKKAEEPSSAEAPPKESHDKDSKAKKKRLPGWVDIAVVALVAAAAGPLSVYAPW